MTNSKFTLFFLCLICAPSVLAAPRSLSKAKAIAEKYMSEKSEFSLMTEPVITDTRAGADQDIMPYYIFNDANNEGFVIVSGSDLMPEVIGYSNRGNVSSLEGALPDNFKSWLSWVSEAYAYLEQHPEAALPQKAAGYSVEPIEPLVETTWGQDYPYNYYCPALPKDKSKRCVTGCVATALSQIIRYHIEKNGAPIKGKGSHHWESGNSKFDVNYSTATYDSKRMPLSLTKNSPILEILEVGKLMYHVGVGVNMNYGESSGTFSIFAEDLLISHFGFNSRTRVVDRFQYSYSEWNQLLYNELKNERPVLFGGNSNSGGHAFVLDGIDALGKYHVNWGWDGHYDGYFDINILDPYHSDDSDNPADGFNYMQDACINACLEEGVGEIPSPLCLYGDLLTDKDVYLIGDTICLEPVQIFNMSTQMASGKFGFQLLKDGMVADTTVIDKTGEMGGFDYINSRGYAIQDQFRYRIPKNVADGSYQLWFYYLTSSQETLCKIKRRSGGISYLPLTFSGGKVYVSEVQSEPLLRVTDWGTDSVQTAPTTLQVTITNQSEQLYTGSYYLRITNSTGEIDEELSTIFRQPINPGESAVIPFEYTFKKAGKYTAELFTESIDELDFNVDIEEAITSFEVTVHPTLGAEFKLLEEIVVLSEGEIKPLEPLKIRYTLSNVGEPYTGEFVLYFYSSSTSNQSIAHVSTPVTFGTAEQESIEVEFIMPEIETNKDYSVRAGYLSGEKHLVFNTASGISSRFTLSFGTTGIKDINYNSNELSGSSVFDIYGNRLFVPVNGSLPKGIFIKDGKKTIAH